MSVVSAMAVMQLPLFPQTDMAKMLVLLNPIPFPGMWEHVVAHHSEACKSMLQLTGEGM